MDRTTEQAADEGDETPDEAPSAEPGKDADGARAGHAPAALVAGGGGRRPPPRRTGVFVDPDDLRDHVGGLLRTMLGTYQVDAFGNFSFLHDGARVFVTVGATPMGPTVGVYSVTNIDLDLDGKLGMFLATTNHRLGFGTLSYDTENRAVWLRHTLLGTTLDAPELQAAVASVARTAASIDDEIGARFGGRTFGEAPQDVQDSTTPPASEDAVNVTGYL